MQKGRFEKATVFTSRTGGIACYRIPALACTSRGTVIAFCEARKRDCGDWAHSAIMARRCTDPVNHLGRWEAPSVVQESKRLVEPRGWTEIVAAAARAEEMGLDQETSDFLPAIDVCTNNPTVIADRDGKTIHLVYCEHYDSMFYTRSLDDGITWAPPRTIGPAIARFKGCYDWTAIASGPGHGLQLLRGQHAGRLIVPVWLASNKNDPHAHKPSQVATIYSDDGGNTWEPGDFVPFEDYSPSESQAIQLDDGRVLMYSRHENKPGTRDPLHRIFTTSPDGARGWTRYQFDAVLPEPVCLGSIIKIPARITGGRSLVLYSSPDGETARRERRNLTVFASEDDCQSWMARRVVEAGAAAYSDLAVDEQYGWIYCIYEDGSILGGGNVYNGFSIARFDMEWLLGGSKKAL